MHHRILGSPRNGKYSIPSCAKKIGDYAFDGAGVCTVSIPEGVEEIGKEAFSYLIDYKGPHGSYGEQQDMEIIELPASLKKIGMSLADSVVLYHGTKHNGIRSSMRFGGLLQKPE